MLSNLYGRLRTVCALRTQQIRFYADNAKEFYAPKVILTDSGSTVVCWHPEEPFPYEHSLPLPAKQEEGDGVLKLHDREKIMAHFKSKHPEVVRQELMKITHTTKHRWFPRARDKYAKKTPPDREYL